MRRTGLLGILLLGALLFACAPKVAPMEKPAAPETVTQVTGKAPWEVEWDKTLKAAKKEGGLLLFTFHGPTVRSALIEGFKNRTGLNVNAVTGRGAELAQKLLTERRAGLYTVDVYVSGSTQLLTMLKPGGALSPIMPHLFLPEVLNESLWYKGELPFMDKEKLVIQTRMMPGGSQQDVAFLPGYVNKSELASWHDLLNPKFKGKMNMDDPTQPGKGGKFINKAITYFGLDWDYMKALAKQEPVIVSDRRLQVEWVVKGKHLLSINPGTEPIIEFKKAGAKVDTSVFKETVDVLGGGASAIVLVKNAPHPDAAKLFLNWFLSKEGQTVFARAYEIQSAREDTPTDHLPEWQIRKPGVKYAIETEDFVLQETKFSPLTLEIFGTLLR